MKKLKRRRGMTLVEMMVSLGLISAISLVLVMLYRAATVEFEHSSIQMTLSQKARTVMDKIVPYASTAVPVNSVHQTFIYSPQVGSLTSQAVTSYPNIYSLDFCTTMDFFTPRTGLNGARFSDLVTINPRGTDGVRPADHYRYRIRFATQDESTIKGTNPSNATSNVPGYARNGQLLLEKVYGYDPNPAGGLPSTTLPAVALNSSSQPLYRLLGHSLNSVTFERKGNSINVRVTVRAITRDGRLIEGAHERNNLGQRRDQAPGSGSRSMRDYTLFSTVIIPYYTGR